MYKNILFIEDEPLIAEMYTSILREEGFKVTIEGDGQRGLEKAQTAEYDLVLLDIMVPSMTGLEVMRNLRDPTISPKCTRDNVHIIVLSNLDEDDIIKREINELTEGYYLKVNITPRSLLEIINKMGTQVAA